MHHGNVVYLSQLSVLASCILPPPPQSLIFDLREKASEPYSVTMSLLWLATAKILSVVAKFVQVEFYDCL